MPKSLWVPSPEGVATANLTAFMETVSNSWNCKLSCYKDLYKWSIAYPEQFWPAVWQFCDIRAKKPWDEVCANGHSMRDAKWFRGASLNFAENLLRFKDTKPAIVFVS
ncbi:MAG: acetoacetate--CoA ligase, partial [Deltaproteobacteria bacterium]|nr:acetoacetate--CoA ligase [Deltaproteobacteria bacterium]